MSRLVLGLDLGPNSVGWALVDEDEQEIVDLGVRVFPEGVDNFDTGKEESRNKQRRDARTMRRQIRRRAQRKRRLRDALIQVGLFPSDPAEQQRLFALNPYELRSRALDEKLHPHEIGRILFHLNQRRGFKSNKKEEAKAEAKAKRKKTGKAPQPETEMKTEDILLEMADLEKRIQESDSRTLGRYLLRKLRSFEHAAREDDDHVRGRHTLRRMLTSEFDLIWKTQSEHHPDILTDALAYGKLGRQKDIHRPLPKWHKDRGGRDDLESFGLFGLIFFHRTLKPVPKEVVGLCELEPKQRRCARADRRAQRFRLLQEINNLRYIDPELNDESRLDDGQRAMLVSYMASRERATFDDLRKKLGFLDSIRFNLEKGKRSSIKGMEVDCLMAKAVGRDWHRLPDEIKDGVVESLVNSVDDDETHATLVEKFALTSDEADRALGVELPAGYSQLSLVAINKLLPHMERGLLYEHSDPSQSARAAAGYEEPWALQRRLFDRLPDPRRTRDCPIGDIPNPVVKRALVELRKVVNAIVREHGRPDAIHVEMGRDVKTRPKDKTSPAYWKYRQEEEERSEREKRRDAAKATLREHGIPYGAGGRNILKYLLWQEQGKACAYSHPTRMISLSQLFTDEIEIDHILPFSQSLDDSPMNKVVCFRSENHGVGGKGQRTPRQWLEHSEAAKYAEVCQRARSLPYAKYKKFLRKDAKIEDFIARQLNDTRYIAKATAEYLKCLFNIDESKQGAVLGLKGQHTSTLRRLWGLDRILSELPDSPAWQEQAQLRFGEKNRADHRHHAIDAVVLALTNRNRLHALAAGFTVKEFVDYGTGEVDLKTVYRGEHISAPWDGFRERVTEKVVRINVSHRGRRKVHGALHDEMPYGRTASSGSFVKRKPVAELSANEIDKIRDEGIKRLVVDHLKTHGLEVGRGKDVDAKKLKAALCDVRMPSGVPVKKVRLLVPELSVQPIRQSKAERTGEPTSVAYVRPGDNHHVCLFEWEANGKMVRDAEYVSRLEAHSRLRRREPLVCRSHSTQANARFLMSLSIGDMVLAEFDGKPRLMVVSKLVATQKRVHLVAAQDARRSAQKHDIGITPNSLIEKYRVRKVTVDPLGRIQWADGAGGGSTSIDEVDLRVFAIAQEIVGAGGSNTEARKRLKKLGLGSRGAELSVALRHLRQLQSTQSCEHFPKALEIDGTLK